MPQLDSASFFTQYVWLVVFFLGFHFILATSYLPKIAKILKVRALKVHAQKSSSSLEKSTIPTALFESHENAAFARFAFTQKTVRKTLIDLEQWLETTKKELQKTYGKKATTHFKDTIGEEALLQASIAKDFQTTLPLFVQGVQHNTQRKNVHAATPVHGKSDSIMLQHIHIFHTKKTLAVLE